jgi:hypothetical protein
VDHKDHDMTDISNIIAAPRTVEIKHPATGEPIGLRMTLRPESSAEVTAAKRRLLNERLQRDIKPSAERLEANALSMIEASVSAWEWQGDLMFEGSKPDFTPANLRKVLKKLSWLRDQLDHELGNDAAFFESSANA